jgi:hypothetical protein
VRTPAPLLLLLLAACGYGFAASGSLPGGLERAAVPPFENRSAEPELGAVVAGSLRQELAARGVSVRGDARGRLVGEVTAGTPSPASPGGTSWRIGIGVKARLLDGERVVAERDVRREAIYQAGIDALETEGRRAQALRAAAADCAREIAASLVE